MNKGERYGSNSRHGWKQLGSYGLIAVALLWGAATTAQADLNTGMDLFKSGKYVEAAAEFQALVDQSPSYDYGFFMMGNCFLKMNKPGDAEKNLLKAVELNGEKFAYHYGLATAYYQQKKYGKAIATLKTSEGLAADNNLKHRLYSLRGSSYYADGKWGDAIDDLEKAKRIKSSANIDKQLGVAYYNAGDYVAALPALTAAAAQSPNDKGTLQRLANANMNLGAKASNSSQKDRYYSDALKYAKKFRDLNPSDGDAHNLLGRAALGANDFGQAEQSFRTVLDKDSRHCYAMANLGKTYIAQSKWTAAEEVLNRAKSCAPGMGVVYESLGFALQKQKRYQEAIPVYEKALSIERKSSTQNALDVCKKNLDINAFNAEQDVLKAENEAEIEAEKERVRMEEEKRRKFERERDQ